MSHKQNVSRALFSALNRRSSLQQAIIPPIVTLSFGVSLRYFQSVARFLRVHALEEATILIHPQKGIAHTLGAHTRFNLNPIVLRRFLGHTDLRPAGCPEGLVHSRTPFRLKVCRSPGRSTCPRKPTPVGKRAGHDCDVDPEKTCHGWQTMPPSRCRHPLLRNSVVAAANPAEAPETAKTWACTAVQSRSEAEMSCRRAVSLRTKFELSLSRSNHDTYASLAMKQAPWPPLWRFCAFALLDVAKYL